MFQRARLEDRVVHVSRKERHILSSRRILLCCLSVQSRMDSGLREVDLEVFGSTASVGLASSGESASWVKQFRCWWLLMSSEHLGF